MATRVYEILDDIAGYDQYLAFSRNASDFWSRKCGPSHIFRDSIRLQALWDLAGHSAVESSPPKAFWD